ncbi:hypothetical protein [Flavobacterium agrisoli]|uniref:Uncharacterized protein n=1 Tax=Flavobacterium agrisoli TaxID=2793066 RepID=A0A934PNN1_9FLAO|nr:hypothetical protein [Flavobacterium agrisoli]MBK0369748.1 hypothetical protein [Flavobacterium agrisoli]
MKTFSKTILILFGATFIIYLVSIFTMRSHFKKDVAHFKKEYQAVNAQKEKILDSLYLLKASYQIAISENTSLAAELAVEKNNVELLMQEIKNTENLSPQQLSNFLIRYRKLQTTMDIRAAEIKKLKSQNKNLLSEIETQNVKMYHQSLQKDTLIRQKEELITKVEKAENLILKDFKLLGIKQKKADDAMITDKSSKIDKLVVSFLVQANALAKAGVKSYFVQIIDQNNLILGERASVILADKKKLIYSFAMDVNYQNKDVTAFGFLNPYEKRFGKGTYFLKIFDNTNLIGSSSLTIQ